MIWWYNTVFLNRQDTYVAVQPTQGAKKQITKAEAIMRKVTKIQNYLKARKQRLGFEKNLAIMAKLSRDQLDDIGFVPTDLQNLKLGTYKKPIVAVKAETQSCEICYLPNMPLQNPDADCGIAESDCPVAKAA
ncbi:MAG: hypothetical protein ACI9J2_002791 [Saprospiraceae bacterium]|jgi:hypothetical protein